MDVDIDQQIRTQAADRGLILNDAQVYEARQGVKHCLLTVLSESVDDAITNVQDDE